MQGIWGSEPMFFAESFYQNALRCLIADMPETQRIYCIYDSMLLNGCMLHRLINFMPLFVLHMVGPETCNTGSAR